MKKRLIYLSINVFLLFIYPLNMNAQYIFYIGTDKKADKAQRQTTATLAANTEYIIAMQKKILQAEENLNFELKEQENFLKKRYPSEQQIDAYIKNSPLVTNIFKDRFKRQKDNFFNLFEQIKSKPYANLFTKSLEKLQNDMEDIEQQWQQATQVSGNSNRLSNAQRNALMQQTIDRFKQVCITTQQLRTTLKALSMGAENSKIQPNVR